MLEIQLVQPPYYAGPVPDTAIRQFITQQLASAKENSLIVLPEYANAAGFGKEAIRNDAFISSGCRTDIFG